MTDMTSYCPRCQLLALRMHYAATYVSAACLVTVLQAIARAVIAMPK